MADKPLPDLKTFIENVNKKDKVNGKKIWTGGFVKNTVKNVIFGLVSSLKGGDDAKEINIKIKM